jgi:hypothetical protein
VVEGAAGAGADPCVGAGSSLGARGAGAGWTGALRTVLTGASVSLTRSRVLVATTVIGSSVCAAGAGVVAAGVAGAGVSGACWARTRSTAPDLINAIADTPRRSARALRVQSTMSAPKLAQLFVLETPRLAGDRLGAVLAGWWAAVCSAKCCVCKLTVLRQSGKRIVGYKPSKLA